MANDNNRTDHSPVDPGFRYQGPRPVVRDPNAADAARRAQRPAVVETAVAAPANEVAALAYSSGIDRILAARIVSLEKQVQILTIQVSLIEQDLPVLEAR